MAGVCSLAGKQGIPGRTAYSADFAAGHAVTVYDDLSEGHRSAVDERATFVAGKPEEQDHLLNAVKKTRPEAILHFAASALVGEEPVAERPRL